MHAMRPLLESSDFPPIRRGALSTLQVNVGYRCNQACVHCHVNAGPTRTEMMSDTTVGTVLDFLAVSGVQNLDITGGAPELNPHFRHLLQEARALGVHVIDRCNLTVLEEPGQGDLAEFLAQHQIEVIASLPCYLEDNVDRQRGSGVYEKSLRALRQLNAVGYARAHSGLLLNLVYNPQGPTLPPPQEQLEAAYREHLASVGITFNHLYALTNMPIARFGSTLVSKGQFDSYMRLLRESHQAANLETVMCRSLLSVDWQGYVYDCDFNQMLGLPVGAGRGKRVHLSALLPSNLESAPIHVAGHCYGCTAGRGSSCGGALR